MRTLPAPHRANYSATSLTALKGFANAAVMRPGDGFIITKSDTDAGVWIEFHFTEAESADKVIVSINEHGIPAVIAELQCLTYGGTCHDPPPAHH